MFCSKTIKKKIVKYSTSQLTTIQTSPLIDKEPTDKDLPHLFVCWREGFLFVCPSILLCINSKQCFYPTAIAGK